MANVKITELPQVSTILGTDIVPTVASSATSKITITDFANSLPQVSSSLSASYLSGSSAIVTNLTSSLNASIGGINVGRGANLINGNIAIGTLIASASDSANIAIGNAALRDLTTGRDNTGIGASSLMRVTNGIQNVGLGALSLWSCSTGSQNVSIGNNTARDLVSGSLNTLLGYNTGRGIITGSFNTIIGSIQGLSSSLNNNIILADGAGNIRAWHNATSWSLFTPVVANQGITGSLFGTASYASNIYNIDGELASNRTVGSGSGYTLTFKPDLILSGSITGSIPRSYTTPTGNFALNAAQHIENYQILSQSAALVQTQGLITSYISNSGSGNFNCNNYGQYILLRHSNVNSTSGSINLFGTLSSVARGYADDISVNTSNGLTGISSTIDHLNNTDTNIFTSTGSLYVGQTQITAGTIGNLYGYRDINLIGRTSVSKGVNVSNLYGYYHAVDIGWTSGLGGAVTSSYGVYLEPVSVRATGILINNWGFYAPDPPMKHHISGTLSIGTVETGSYQLSVVGNTGISGSLTATGSILFPSLTQAPQNNIVTIDTATGQLYYTGSSTVIPSSSISASYAPNIYNSDGELTGNRYMSGSQYTLTLEPTLTLKNPIYEINRKYVLDQSNFTTSSISASLAVYGTVENTSEAFKSVSGIYNIAYGINNSTGSDLLAVNSLISYPYVAGTTLTNRIFAQGAVIYAYRRGISGSRDISENANNALTGINVGTSFAGGPYASTSSYLSTQTGIFLNNTATTGRVGSMYGIRIFDNITHYVNSDVSGSTITNYYGIRLQSTVGTTSGPTASIANYYSIRISPPTIGATGTISGLYGIYADDSRMSHYYAGAISIGTTTTGSYQLQVVGNTGISGSLVVTGSVQISNILTLPPQDPLPTGAPTGSIAVSGSGVDCKPYFWNGNSWTSLI